MIGYLRGHVICSHGSVNTIGSAISGDCTVGYEVHVNGSPGVGAMQALFVHEHAPQDAPHELYGFETIAERELFRRLLNIKGVGPKVAMRITYEYAAGEGTMAWTVYRLTHIRGVGATIAQRICEEMQ